MVAHSGRHGNGLVHDSAARHCLYIRGLLRGVFGRVQSGKGGDSLGRLAHSSMRICSE